jgi:ribonuclease P protein subunit RPR2
MLLQFTSIAEVSRLHYLSLQLTVGCPGPATVIEILIMAKEKSSKNGTSGIPQKHLYSRVSFLHQAASYLVMAGSQNTTERPTTSHVKSSPAKVIKEEDPQSFREGTRLLMHLRGVSRKSQIRLEPKVKHSICKRCDTLLIPGKTRSNDLVNYSRNCRKDCDDLLEIRCEKCKTIKRFPVGIQRLDKKTAASSMDR